MLRAGVDLIEVERVERALARYGSRFLARVFTPAEQEYAAGRSQSLAARFAAKEAISKLLGVGIQHPRGIDWLEIEVISSQNGAPSVHLRGRAAERAAELGLTEFALSLSHTREHAVALVVAQ